MELFDATSLRVTFARSLNLSQESERLGLRTLVLIVLLVLEFASRAVGAAGVHARALAASGRREELLELHSDHLAFFIAH
jgi:hypothetical protein